MDYKFEFKYDDISYYSKPMNEFGNSFYYYSKHKNSEHYIPIKKDDFDRIKAENEDDVNSLGATAFFFLLIIGLIYWFITSLKETVNGL